MRQIIRQVTFLTLFLSCTLGSAHEKSNDNTIRNTKYTTESITISGEVENKFVLSIEDLRKFPDQKMISVTIVNKANTPETIKGLRLRDILDRAVITSKDHNDVKKMIIIASASDGYKVVFSWSELFNTDVGDGVVVFFEKNGKPLDANEGQIALISSKDIRSGPRHVKWLQAIEVKKVVD